MNPILLLSLSKFKKNKGQNLVIIVIIMLCTMLLSTAVVIMRNTSEIYIDSHTAMNGSHEILHLNNNIYDEKEIQKYWDKQEGVDVSPLIPYQSLSGIKFKGEEFLNVQAHMVNTPKVDLTVDKLNVVKGDSTIYPESGTIWIPTSLAYSKNIEIGDRIEFNNDTENLELEVSAIVIDLPYCAPFANSARIWMNPDDYITHFDESINDYMIAIRYMDYSSNREYWTNFEEYLNAPYLESVKNFPSLSAFYMVTSRIIGFVMIFLAIIMILIAIFTVGFTISDDIITSYKTLGIIQSLGLLAKKIIHSNMLLYGGLSIIGILPGIILSYIFSNLIMQNTMSYLKIDSGNMNTGFGLAVVGVSLFIMVLILFASYSFTQKIRSIKPAQSIRFGTSEKNYEKLSNGIGNPKKRFFSFDRLPVAFVIGIKGISKNKGSSFFIVLVTTLTSSVLVFGFLLLYSVISMNQNIEQWGYDDSDISILIKENAKDDYGKITEVFEKDTRIESYNLYGDINAVVPAQTDIITGESYNESMSILLSVVDGSYDDIGYTTLEGRNPVEMNEIALGINIANKYGYKIGDSFQVYIDGHKANFIVTGTYQAIANMAFTGRVYGDAIRELSPDYNILDAVFVNLKDGISSKDFVEEINNSNEFTALTKEELVNEVFSELIAILLLPMLILGGTFIISAFVIIYCISIINIKRQSSNYGIYKSVGLSTKKIRFFITTSTFTLALIGIVLGAIFGAYFIPIILNKLLINYGIVKMPIIMSYIGILICLVISLKVASLGTWHASRYIKTTSPRVLTIE